MERFSPQREAIMTYLRSTTEHPSAETVYKNVSVDHPHISLGTVYRNLSRFVENGEVRKVTSLDGVDHFDADLRPHYHFICRRCGGIQDIWMPEPEHLVEAASPHVAGSMEGHDIAFFGTCTGCCRE